MCLWSLTLPRAEDANGESAAPAGRHAGFLLALLDTLQILVILPHDKLACHLCFARHSCLIDHLSTSGVLWCVEQAGAHFHFCAVYCDLPLTVVRTTFKS